MSERFYTNLPLQDGPVEITGAEAHHLATVCRLRPDDVVCLFNGDGHEYPARITAVTKRSVVLDVMARESPARELPFTLHVSAPIPRGDRAQFLVEKLTEIGVTVFTPLRTERSVVHPGDAKLEKLERYVIEASKQCGRNQLMRIEKLANWVTFCSRADLGIIKILGHSGGKDPALLATGLPHAIPAVPSFTLAVGPEGGLSNEEVGLAARAGWHLLDMGPRIFRVETAALVLASWIVAWRGMTSKTAPPKD